jgi:CspA family cold shock protein
MKGKVKFFNHEKEFGFIIGDDGKDYFVHKSGLKEGLAIDKDDSVEFTSEKGDRGLKAVKVSKA